MGDTFNITIRNIQTHAKFGVMMSCTLIDSFIDNIQMFGEYINAIYFAKGDYDNIRFSNINYTNSCRYLLDEFDKKYFDCTVYFDDAKCKNIYFNGITTSKSNKAVFSGSGDITLNVRDIIYKFNETKLSIGNSININKL